ncbi:MAG TPA: urea ABC transporter permease subunit UrtC [Tepidisphaeraceae bacterium]|nr:urea ABC transporter permease subunit UrtC [Tepidisphaeraceae bacterium]
MSDQADNLPLDPAIKRLRVAAVAGVLLLLFAVIPALSLTGVVENHLLNRVGRYLALAIVALGIDLIWGYTGVLSLCQAFFFCLGGYAVGMFLALPGGGGDVRPEYNSIPQFLYFANPDSKALPAFWQPFNWPAPWGAIATVAAIFVVPAVVAGVIGFFVFRSRVRGVYFSIVTQAIAWGAWLAFSRNEMLVGGSNGLTNFYKPLNQAKPWILGLYFATLVVLLLCYLLCRGVTRSRLGRVLVAVRDKESRLYFAGYRPYAFKLFAFVVAAVLAAVGGMLYVPQTGIMTPNNMTVAESIGMVVWVAVGGRGRLWGAVAGALLVNFMYSALTSDLPVAWPFVQGAMFVAVVLLFPDGFVGVWDKLERRVADRAGAVAIAAVAVPLAAIAAFVVVEALGLWPAALRSAAFELGGVGRVLWKYVLLVGVIAGGSALGWWRSAQESTRRGFEPELVGTAGKTVG